MVALMTTTALTTPVSTYVGPAIVNSAALNAFRTARANRNSASCDIVVIGDSWGENSSTTPYTNGFVHKLAAGLEAAFPTTGLTPINRSTYLPWDWANGAGNYLGAHLYTASTGTWTGQGSGGPGRRNGRPATVGDSLTYSITGDGFAIAYWCQSPFGVIGVKIDGVSQTDLDTAVGTNGQRISALYAMSAGTHTIEISWKSGSVAPMFHGMMVYSGNQSKGVRVIDGNRAAANSGDYVNMSSWLTDAAAVSSPDAGIFAPDLALINLSLTNDYNNQTSLATFQSNIQALLTALRAHTPNLPVLLWAPNAPNDQGAKTIPWTSYRDVYATIAATDALTAFVDLSSYIPSALADTGINAFWFTDLLHPNSAGHATLAGYLTTVLSSPAVTVTTTLQPMETGNTAIGVGTTNAGQGGQFTVHTARGGSSGLVLTFAATTWDVILGEVPLGNDMLIRAAIEYPLGSGTFANVTFGGAVQGTVVNGTYQDSDAFGRTWADGDQYGVWVWASGANLPIRGTGGANNVELYTDEGCIVSASVSTTPTHTIADNFTRRRRLCALVGIFATRPVTDTTVAAVGDSITAGAYALATPDHVRGDLCRTISINYACINLGWGAQQVSSIFAANLPIYTMLARRASVIADAFGINLFNNQNLTAAHAIAYWNRWKVRWNGKRYIVGDLFPQTASTDSWVTEANQTVKSWNADINTYNATMQAQANYLPRRAALHGSTSNDKFPADGATAFLYVVDGLHPTAAGISLAVATAAAYKAQIDASTALLAATQPSVTLNGAYTFTGGKLTNGTLTLDGSVPISLPFTMEGYFSATGISGFSMQAHACNLFITTGGFLKIQRGDGTQVAATTTVVTDGVERHIRVCIKSTGIDVYLNGVLELTTSYTVNATQSVKQLSISAATGGAGTVRNVSLFAGSLNSGAFTPPSPGWVTSSTALLVFSWPLATDKTGIIGPMVPQ